jgi:CRISPR/Cas system endoribonuclease Cas6 (RAMP superfamily)
MILEIKFTKGSKSYSSPLNEKINGFINSCLGKNNEYHGHFSNYSVSSLQGAVINESENTKSYVNGAYLYISSPHSEFLGKIIANLMPMVNNRGIDDMMVDSFEIKDFPVHYEYDLVRTIDPIMLHGTNDKIYTFKDEDFIEKLTENSKQKLIKEGIPENVANTIKIYPFHLYNISEAKLSNVGIVAN